MNDFWQAVITSGVFTLITTLIITRIFNKGFSQIDRWQQKKTDEAFLMMAKMDKMGDLTILMANKLHEAGIINGDLEELKKEYHVADAEYDKHIKMLAAEILKK